MKTNRSHHKQPHLSAAHQGTGRQQGCEGLSQTHLIRQNSATTGQEPTDPGALMAQRATTIVQDLLEIRRGHKGPVWWQRWQGVLTPVEPLLQSGSDGETTPQDLLKCIGCGQGEVPTMACAVPKSPGPNPTQLGLSDRVERAYHTNQPRWRKIQITIRCGLWWQLQAPTNNHLSEL